MSTLMKRSRNRPKHRSHQPSNALPTETKTLRNLTQLSHQFLHRWPLHLGSLALGLCLTGNALAGETAQAQQPSVPTIAQATVLDAATVEISPGQRVLIEELLTLTNQEALFSQTMAITMDQVTSSLPALMEGMVGESLDEAAIAEGQAVMERMIGKLLTGFQERVSFQDIAEVVYYPLYAKNFTEAQLQDMIDFYNTPTGQHTIAVMPQLVQDSMGLTQQRIMPVMIEVLQEVMAEEMGSL